MVEQRLPEFARSSRQYRITERFTWSITNVDSTPQIQNITKLLIITSWNAYARWPYSDPPVIGMLPYSSPYRKYRVLGIEVHVRLKGRAIGCDKIRKADVSLSNNVKWNNGNGFKENEERNQDWWRQRSSERWPSLVIYNSTSLIHDLQITKDWSTLKTLGGTINIHVRREIRACGERCLPRFSGG